MFSLGFLELGFVVLGRADPGDDGCIERHPYLKITLKYEKLYVNLIVFFLLFFLKFAYRSKEMH